MAFKIHTAFCVIWCRCFVLGSLLFKEMYLILELDAWIILNDWLGWLEAIKKSLYFWTYMWKRAVCLFPSTLKLSNMLSHLAESLLNKIFENFGAKTNGFLETARVWMKQCFQWHYLCWMLQVTSLILDPDTTWLCHVWLCMCSFMTTQIIVWYLLKSIKLKLQTHTHIWKFASHYPLNRKINSCSPWLAHFFCNILYCVINKLWLIKSGLIDRDLYLSWN